MAIATAIRGSDVRVTAQSLRRRLLVIAAGAAAAAIIWSVAALFGVKLLVRFGSGAPQTVGVGLVLAAALTASLLGLALLAFLERRTPRAAALWTRLALGVLTLSFALPLAAGATMTAKLLLTLMHVVVGAVVITGLRRS